MSADAALDRLTAALEGRYTVERELGSGGMAHVYLAHDARHDRKVAVKVLRPELAAAVGAERFLAEIKLTARLQHPHILPLHDSGERDGVLYYVMPFAEGESLRDRLDREKQIPIDEAVAITRAVAAALEYAHGHDIVHRDIKPENILLVAGEAVVADFGIALAVDVAGPTRLTEQGVSLGTPMYMSPEQATGEPVDGRADIHALGAVLYEMLAGQPPYSGATVQAFVARLLTEQPVRPRLLRDTVGEELDGVIMKALAKVPADRYQAADAFSRALAAAVAPARPARGPRAAPLAAAAVAALAIGVAAWRALGGAASAPAPIRAERQVTFDGSVLGASLSPDGGFFTYTTYDGVAYKLYVSEVGGGGAVLLDSVPDLMCCSTWSPDGSRIAYQRGTRSRGATMIVPRLGGARRAVRAEVALAWSPDGSELLSWWPAARVLTLTDVASGATVDSVPLGSRHDWVGGADWSPDGSRIVVSLQDSVAFRIRTVTRDGSVVDDVVTDSTSVTSPRWARDGSGIYFRRSSDTEDVGASSSIWKVPVTREGRRDGAPRRLLSGADVRTLNTTIPSFSVSDDGERLILNRVVGHANLWRFSEGDGAGGEPAVREPLTRGTARRTAPRLSPDGRQLAYVEAIDGRRNLFVMPSDGGAARQLTFFENGVRWPAWSPSGLTIAAAGLEGPEDGLWVVDPASGRFQRAPLESFDGDELAWAPGGIVYQTRDHAEVRILDTTTWTSRPVLTARRGTWWYDLRLGGDARTLYLRRTGDTIGLWRLDLATGEITPAGSAEEPMAAIGAGPGGEGFVAMRVGSRQELVRQLYLVPAAGGEAALYLTLPLGQSVGSLDAALSADGRTLFAAVPVMSSDVWIVEEFDPR